MAKTRGDAACVSGNVRYAQENTEWIPEDLHRAALAEITEKSDYVEAERTDQCRERKAAAQRMAEAVKSRGSHTEEELCALLWDTLALFQNEVFYTAKKLKFSYYLKGNEMFVTRKEKTITKASVMLAFRKALELGGVAGGPKKLGTFGASYLYPVFLQIGVLRKL